MIKTSKKAILFGALFAFLGIAIGAFGAHGLKPILSDYQLALLETAVHYQFIHALGLLCIGTLQMQIKASLNSSINMMIAGTILFSGSLYLIIGTDIRVWGAITPFGGLALMLAWAILFFSFLKQN